VQTVPTFALTVCLALASVPAITDGAPSSAGDEFMRSVASAELRRDDELEDLATELVRLPDALDAFFAIGSTGKVSGSDGEALPVTEKQTRLLSQTAARFQSRAVLVYIREHLTEEASDAWRRTALRLLSLHATSKDFSLLARLVILDRTYGSVRTALLEPFQAAVVSIIQRHGWNRRELSWLANEADPLRGVLIRAVGSAGDPDGLQWLAVHLEDPELSATALQEIGRLAPQARPELAAAIARSVRPLLKSPTSSTRKQVLRALGELGDPLSIPFLILVLEQSLANGEQRMAHSALRRISGVDLPAQPSAWQHWYAEEQRWLQENGARSMERLGSEDDAAVVSAVRDLSEHPLHRNRIAVELTPVLSTHASPGVRGQVCLALARLGSQAALPDLVEALEDDDPTVRRHARTALSALGSSPR
jgi:HEAT repeat protein